MTISPEPAASSSPHCRLGVAWIGALALTLGAAALTGCIERHRLLPVASTPLPAAASNGPAKFHLRDGGVIVADTWSFEGPAIRGTGRTFGAERAFLADGAFNILRDEVVIVEMTEKHASPALITLSILSTVSLAGTALCASNPKACFGSCPTFYVPSDAPSAPGDAGWKLQAEGFSSSIARALEADDLDDLPDARPKDGFVTLQMRNEALETHMVRALSLEVVRAPAGSTVLRGFGPGYFAVGVPVAPSTCAGPAPSRPDDICRELATVDGDELLLPSDGVDLASQSALSLRFPPPGKRDVALVLTARNSLMSTFVLYHMIALHGSHAGDYIAALERGEPGEVATLLRFAAQLGELGVYARQGAAPFRHAGWLDYIGPIARATRGLRFAVDDPAKPVDVELRFTRSHWRFDAVRLAPLVAGDLSATPVAAEVVEAKGRDRAGVAASLRGEGDRVVTMPGDEILLRFPVPPAPAAAIATAAGEGTTAYFLKSRGYYYEWIREEWLRDEDLVKARAYLDDPERAYRELAPMYRGLEPSMESIFQASRFRGERAP